MADVDLQIVREFFELNVFRVLTNWQQESWKQRASECGPQLFVENVQPRTLGNMPFVLRSAQVCAIERAIVHVRAWHADRFYPSMIETSPVFSQFDAAESKGIAGLIFSERPYVKILVISELPVAPELRERSLALLKDAGIDYVLEFAQILQDLLSRVSINASYPGSPALQMLRLLKRYKLVRDQQLEFAFPTEPPLMDVEPRVETALPPSDTEAD